MVRHALSPFVLVRLRSTLNAQTCWLWFERLSVALQLRLNCAVHIESRPIHLSIQCVGLEHGEPDYWLLIGDAAGPIGFCAITEDGEDYKAKIPAWDSEVYVGASDAEIIALADVLASKFAGLHFHRHGRSPGSV